MPPSLVTLSGPFQGRTFDLTGDGFAIGRHAANDLAVPDLSLSRHHCALRRADGAWSVADLGSRYGTFVNGRPVGEAALRHGDLIAAGDSTFLLLLDAPPREEPQPAADPVLEAGTEIRLPAGEYGRLGSQTSRALAGLLDLASVAASSASAATATTDGLDVDGLAARLLAPLLAAVPAERAAFLRVDEEGAFPVAWKTRQGQGGAGSFPVSRSLAARALQDRVALLYNALEEGTAPAESVVASGIRSAACVPLFGGSGGPGGPGMEAPLGLFYVDTREPGTGLGADDLQVLAAAGVLGSAVLRDALRLERLEQENRRLQEMALGNGLVGESPALRRVSEVLARAAPTASTVLILGESGTGKELAARALHASSRRPAAPFVAINCASLSETLLESELFGHEKGAFTGAVTRKTGKIEVANGGTLFLDEVGELPMTLQAKLLRVLQERTFERVGGTRPIAVDVRLVAATNRDLPKEVADGRFRADLYYRLNVITVTLPPLRHRKEDIPLLASHFAALHGRAVRGRRVAISPAARGLLVRYGWPGNVRELSNAVERAVVLGDGEEIRPEDLPESLLEAAPAAGGAGGETGVAGMVAPYHEALNRARRQIILDALAESGGTVTHAAERLGLHPNHLHRLITSLDLRS